MRRAAAACIVTLVCLGSGEWAREMKHSETKFSREESWVCGRCLIYPRERYARVSEMKCLPLPGGVVVCHKLPDKARVRPPERARFAVGSLRGPHPGVPEMQALRLTQNIPYSSTENRRRAREGEHSRLDFISDAFTSHKVGLSLRCDSSRPL